MKRFVLFTLAAASAACSVRDAMAPVPSEVSARSSDIDVAAIRSRTIYGLDESNRLVTFRLNAPQTILSVIPITGLPSGERVVAIDFRPADGTLLGLGAGSRIYRIDAVTGASSTLGGAQLAPLLSGRSFGFDFNPTVDRIRVHSDAEQNLRLHPDLGTTAAVDTALAYAAGDVNAGTHPDVVASAYTNSFLNGGTFPTTTILYAIDRATNALVRLPSANGGKLTTVGALGLAPGRMAGFDIFTNDNLAVASLNTGATYTGFYRIALSSGAATLIGPIGHTEKILGISAQPE